VSKGLGKFTAAKSKCVTKCQQGARKTPPTNPASDCNPPYAGTTLTCVADPVKGAEGKAISAIRKACDPTFVPGKDCPECYDGGDCTQAGYAGDRVASVESQLDAFVGLIWCDDSGSGDGLNAVEAKCQDTVAKTLAKFVAAKSKCYDNCVYNMFKGKIPPGYQCLPPATEPFLVACINNAEAKAIDGIDKFCLDDPECYVPNFDTGAEWVSIAESAVDANIVQTYCGSPSGAFLD
jgi:hypothetical protein